MKLNLSKKQMIFALLYSSLLPIFFYNDMQISINNVDFLGISEYSRFITSCFAILTLPFLIIPFGIVFIMPSFIFETVFIQLFIFICILIQVIVVIHFINKREKKQQYYFSKRKKEKE